VLSGHTHGTQIDAPFLRRFGPAHPGLRVALGATTLLVTRGLGVVGVPLRFGAEAEVLLVTLAAR
jgi:predicted MPP superfamily phosphohydrolase